MPVFDPKSAQAEGISTLFLGILLIAFLIVLLVSGLIIYAGIKFRQKGDDKTEPRQVSGSLRMEIAWTAAPAIILIAVFIPTVMVMNQADPSIPKNLNSQVEIIGHQFWWEYQLPQEKVSLPDGKQGPVILANELHIPVGAPLYAGLESGDVNHNFWVPQLSRKIDLIKGQRNHLMLGGNVPGLYKGACAEYCGTQHAWMLLSVRVDPPDQYQAWLQQQKAVPAPPTDPKLAHGQQVFLNNTCVNCHAIYGTSALAQVGPSLTHIGGRTTIGAGIMENTSDNLKKWIKNVQVIKPGVRMPGYNSLSDQDLQDLTDYLESLK